MIDNKAKINAILVDDDPDDRMLFENAFSDINSNSNLLAFKNGAEAISHFEQNETEAPHIVFLDLNMPLVDGLEVLDYLRRSEKYQRVPIVIYSTSSAERDIQATLSAGANIYIVKPNTYQKLKLAIDKALRMQWQYFRSNLSIETFVMVIE